MTRRLTGRSLVVFTCLLATLGAGCTPGSTPSPTPSTTSATAVATPSETAQEHEERLAYEAAEKSYRTFRGEYYRVLGIGGADGATSKMKATAAGPYLEEAVEAVQAYKGTGSRSTGRFTIDYVHGNGYTPDEVSLRTCEDTTDVRTFDADGKVTGRGELRLIDISVRRVHGDWKTWSGTGQKVSTCAP